jgi:uncharacterized membrane protein
VKEFLKTTFIGGMLFLLPVAFVVFILSYALRLVKNVAEPIANILHLNIGAATTLSVVTLALLEERHMV